MKQKWLILFLLFGGLLSLLAGCTTRMTPTPPAGAPVGPPAPTQGAAVPTAAPTAPAVVQETAVPGTAAPQPTAPTALVAPELTVKGTLANGVSWGTTGDGNFFKGDPNAPLLMFEFSEYQ